MLTEFQPVNVGATDVADMKSPRSINNIIGIVALIAVGIAVSIKALLIDDIHVSMTPRAIVVVLYWLLAACGIVIIVRSMRRDS
jgi:hypothetical protein